MPNRSSMSWCAVVAVALSGALAAHGQTRHGVATQAERDDFWRTRGGRVTFVADAEALASMGLSLEGAGTTASTPTPSGVRAEFQVVDDDAAGLYFTTRREAFRAVAEGSVTSLGLMILTAANGDAFLIGDFDFRFAESSSGFPTGRATERFDTGREAFEVSGGFLQFDPVARQLQWLGIDVRMSPNFAREIGAPDAGGAIIATMSFEAPAEPTADLPSSGPTPPPGEPSGPETYSTTGPDVIVGAVAGESGSDIIRHGRNAGLGITAYSVETTSCNIGSQNVSWNSNTNGHPVIGQNVYRLKNGRFEHVGQSWLKHGFFALSSAWCFSDCQGTDGSTLGVHCSDAYSASLNGQQSNLGPKWQVNAATGVYPYPPANPGTQATIGRRLQVHDADIDPALNSGALYFVEGHYVTADDAAANNKDNNASYRRVQFTGTAPTFTLALISGQSTHQQSPGIQAWKDQDAAVTLVNVDIPSDGRMILGYKVTDNGNGTWHYEWALYNMSSDRSGQAFSVPVSAGMTLTNVGFHDVDDHSNNATNAPHYSLTDWTFTNSGGVATWSTSTFAQDPNSNALRWGTLYNFRFDANVAPQSGNATIALFTSGSPASMTAATQVPTSACTDVNPPVITCPGNQTREATSASGAVVTFTPTATDDCTASPAISCAPTSGATFALGATTVNCTATDNASRTASCSFTVTVRDTTAPAIVCSGNLTRECTGASGAAVSFTTTATDAVDPTPTVTCSPTSGSLFPFGNTTVTCSASDHASPPNTSSPCSFTVTVRDTTAPTITCSSNLTAECTGATGAAVSFTVTSTDACDANPSVSCVPASGSTFGFGATTVNCTASDHAVPANSRNCSFTVTVRDTTAPAITCPSNISTACTGTSGAVVTYTTTASDTCDASPTVSCSPASGAAFAVGTTTVNCTASDHAVPVNSRNCSFTVTVTDTAAPTITCPANVTTECTSANGAIVSFTATATDACDANPIVNCSPTSGSTFAFGVTTVNCTASDHASPPNSQSCSFTVTVRDTTAPALNCAANFTAEATSASGAVVNFNVTATDACDASPISSCSPASGSTFGFGTTTVNCSANDHASPPNSRSCSFTVTVRDTTAPTLTCPADFTAACTSSSGANVTFSVTATDAVDPAPTLSCSPASGSLFPFGATTVNCTTSDHDSPPNSRSCSFQVTVSDTAAPALTCPADLTLEATGPSGAMATYSVTANDGCDLSPTLNVTPASGSVFAIGTTTVNATATDASNNSRSCSFHVIVRDTTPPTISCPFDITADCNGSSGGVVVTYSASATDVVDPNPTVTCLPASGSTFPSGSTTVVCRATDASDNVRSCSFHVIVGDNTSPTISCPSDFTIEAAGPSGAVASFSVTATDACDSNPSVTSLPASGSLFSLGTTTVIATASDGAGNTTSCSFHLAVVDTTSPAITCPADLTVPCTGPAGATVSYSATATDSVDPSPTIICSPASGTTFPFGGTTVSCTASDSSGNSSTCTFRVTVIEPNSCLTGNVNLAAGPNAVADVMRVNGSAGDRCTREVVVPLNAPITVSLDAAPQGPPVARYATYAWLGPVSNSRTLVIGGRTIGCTIDPTPFDATQSPQAFRCLRGGFGPEYCAGTREFASPPSSAPWMLTRSRGFSRARTLFIQTVMEDNGSANASGLSVSNAVYLNVH